ncbi:MAG: porin family protein [Hyphomonadaceae bacterium]|nr:porin family protein [Hyphomonadaceae bacterium]
MKLLVISASLAALAAIATPAAAQSGDTGLYAGLGGTWFSADDVDVTGATGRVGYRFTPNFGVEGEASFGIEGDEAEFLGTPVDVDLDNQYGAYAVGFLPLTERMELLGRVGWASIDAQGSIGDFSAGAEDDGLGVGVGAQYHFTDHFALRGDYTRLTADNDDGDDGVDTFGVSGIWSF